MRSHLNSRSWISTWRRESTERTSWARMEVGRGGIGEKEEREARRRRFLRSVDDASPRRKPTKRQSQKERVRILSHASRKSVSTAGPSVLGFEERELFPNEKKINLDRGNWAHAWPASIPSHPFLRLSLVTALFILGARFFGDRWLDRMDFGWTILAVCLARKFVGWNDWFWFGGGGVFRL